MTVKRSKDRRGGELDIQYAVSVRSPQPLVGRCACGKCRLSSEQAAKNVVLEARIARALRNSHRRHEDRHYRCRYGGWHTTSQPPLNATAAATSLSA